MIKKEKISINGEEFEVRKVEKSIVPKTYKRSNMVGGFTYDLSMVEEYEKIMQQQAEFDRLEAENPDKLVEFKEVVSLPPSDQDVEFWRGVKELKAILKAQKVFLKTREIVLAFNAYKNNGGEVKNTFEYENCTIEKVGKDFKILRDNEERFFENTIISGKEKLYLMNNVDFTPSTLSNVLFKYQFESVREKMKKLYAFANSHEHTVEIDGQIYNRKQYNTAKDLTKKEISQRTKEANKFFI